MTDGPNNDRSAARRRHAIDDLLDRATFAARGATLTRGLAFGVTALAATILLAAAIDATLALPPALLVAADLLLLLAVVAGLTLIVARSRRVTADPRHLARVLEERSGIPNNQLLNALEFERDGRSLDGASRDLVRRTIESGERIAPAVVAGVVVDRAAVRRALLWTPAVPVLAILVHLVVPNLFAMTFLRFADPFGHHPAFTSLVFDVEVNPEAVKHGRPALIAVGIGGPVRAERADIVFVDPDDPGHELDAVPMVAEPAESGERFALRIDAATESRSFLVRTPHGSSALHRMEVLPVPGFERASATLRPPAYTGWPAEDRAFAGDLHALRDSTLAVRATATLPLREGRLDLVGPDGTRTTVTLAPSAADPRTVEGTLPATAGGSLELSLVGADGTESDERRSATLLVAEDGEPVIRVIEPDERCYVVEGWAVDVVFEAEDDVGIRSIDLVRGVNGFPPSTAPLPPSGGDSRRTVARAHFDTAELGAKSGDLLRVFAVAWDGHPDPPHSARSSIVTIEVLSQEEYAEMTRADERVEDVAAEAATFDEEMKALAAERERLLAELAKAEAAEAKAEAERASGKADAEAAKEADEANEAERRKLAEELERYGERSQELGERMRERAEREPVFDAEAPWQETIKKQAEGLQAQKESAAKLAGACRNPAASARSEREDAQRQFQKTDQPFGKQSMEEGEQTAQDLDKLAAAERLLDRTEAVRQAILDQRAVADQMAQFRQRDQLTPQESLQLQDLADEQQALAERLEQARQELERTAGETAERLPKMSAQAKEISQKIQESKASEDQRTASGACRRNDGRGAHESAENAARKLESLLSECSSQSQQEPMNQDLDGCLKMPKPGLKQALNQMANARLGPMSRMGQKGGRGGGFSGMSANASIVGPHRPQGKPNRESRTIGGDAETKSAADGDLSARRAGDAESIEASATRTTAGDGSLLGVPAPYRDDAAAYFRRIAEDAKRPSPKDGTKPNGEGATKP